MFALFPVGFFYSIWKFLIFFVWLCSWTEPFKQLYKLTMTFERTMQTSKKKLCTRHSKLQSTKKYALFLLLFHFWICNIREILMRGLWSFVWSDKNALQYKGSISNFPSSQSFKHLLLCVQRPQLTGALMFVCARACMFVCSDKLCSKQHLCSSSCIFVHWH